MADFDPELARVSCTVISDMTGHKAVKEMTLALSEGPDRFDFFSSNDHEEIQNFASNLFCPHEFQLDPKERKLATRIASTSVGNIGFSSVQYGANAVVDPGRLTDFYLAQITTAGSLDVRCGQQRCWAGNQNATVLSPTEPSFMRWNSDAVVLTVQISRKSLERQLEDLTGRQVDHPLVFKLDLDLATESAQPWLAVVSALYQHCRFVDWHRRDPVAADQLERWLITTLLHTQQHNYSERLNRSRSREYPRPLDAAIKELHAKFVCPPSTAELANLVGVSGRQLRGLFRRHVGQTVKQYSQKIKLDRVRQRLLSAPIDSNVTRILSDQGVTHHGRFASAYRARFGQTPSQTLRERQA